MAAKDRKQRSDLSSRILSISAGILLVSRLKALHNFIIVCLYSIKIPGKVLLHISMGRLCVLLSRVSAVDSPVITMYPSSSTQSRQLLSLYQTRRYYRHPSSHPQPTLLNDRNPHFSANRLLFLNHPPPKYNPNIPPLHNTLILANSVTPPDTRSLSNIGRENRIAAPANMLLARPLAANNDPA